MKNRVCYLFLFDGFADWEPSLVTTGLNTYGDFEVRTFSVDGKPVKSMGSLSVNPDFKLKEIQATNLDLLILPGGNAWEEGRNSEISELVKAVFHQGKTIAAICAATTFLAKLGLFNTVKHTSNGLEYLKNQVPDYTSDNHYVNEPCVLDKNIITANGAAMIEFAHTIFTHFSIFKKGELDEWLTLYKSAGIIQ